MGWEYPDGLGHDAQLRPIGPLRRRRCSAETSGAVGALTRPGGERASPARGGRGSNSLPERGLLFALAQQEIQRGAVKRLWILVEGAVGEVVKDDQFAVDDPAGEWVGEAR